MILPPREEPPRNQVGGGAGGGGSQVHMSPNTDFAGSGRDKMGPREIGIIVSSIVIFLSLIGGILLLKARVRRRRALTAARMAVELRSQAIASQSTSTVGLDIKGGARGEAEYDFTPGLAVRGPFPREW